MTGRRRRSPTSTRITAPHGARPRSFRNDLLLRRLASKGIARPDQWLAAAGRRGATAGLLALDLRRFPHDVASLGRYDRALAALPHLTRPWTPVPLDTALDRLTTAGLDIVGRRRRPLSLRSATSGARRGCPKLTRPPGRRGG